jgi:hypothetical protein
MGAAVWFFGWWVASNFVEYICDNLFLQVVRLFAADEAEVGRLLISGSIFFLIFCVFL